MQILDHVFMFLINLLLSKGSPSASKRQENVKRNPGGVSTSLHIAMLYFSVLCKVGQLTMGEAVFLQIVVPNKLNVKRK